MSVKLRKIFGSSFEIPVSTADRRNFLQHQCGISNIRAIPEGMTLSSSHARFIVGIADAMNGNDDGIHAFDAVFAAMPRVDCPLLWTFVGTLIDDGELATRLKILHNVLTPPDHTNLDDPPDIWWMFKQRAINLATFADASIDWDGSYRRDCLNARQISYRVFLDWMNRNIRCPACHQCRHDML